MKIVIANLKGGTCKTTTALFLAQAAVMRGIPTVVWDADIQASASDWAYGCQQKGTPLPFEVLAANASTVCRDDPEGRLVIVDTHPSGQVMDKAVFHADFVVAPTTDSESDYQQTWQFMRQIPATVPARVLMARSEWNTAACRQLVDALDEQRIPRFSAIIRKRQPLKLAMGRPIGKLYEYADVMAELACGLDLPAARPGQPIE